ncbi:acyltransferase family protein [Brackiella oedipodis]|uniref:acyltransferase family protein n=1 Tax=Brackiella oedipodis TaxID=124225 RepID=UPI0006869762|nr:acyltransferase [Brackiella oedipodis]
MNNASRLPANKAKITYLEGLRGLCCLIVVFEHMITDFKPDLRFTDIETFWGSVRRFVAWSPLNIIYNGFVPVCIFFILSGFVLSRKFIKSQNYNDLFVASIKRYPRLILPVLGSMIFTFLVFKGLDVFYGTEFELKLFKAIKQGVYFAPFEHKPVANIVLWSISYEMYGSFLVFALLAFFGKQKHRFIFYSIVLLFFYLRKDGELSHFYGLYGLFIFGLILSDIYIHRHGFTMSPIWRFIWFALGMFLVSTPMVRTEGESVYQGIYSYLQLFHFNPHEPQWAFIVLPGAMLVFASILGSTLAQRFFDLRFLQFLGRISFSLYLLHFVIVKGIKTVVMPHFDHIGALDFVFLVILTLAICFGLSIVYERWVDQPAIKWANKFANRVNRADNTSKSF